MSDVILTPTAVRHFEQAMRYTRENFGVAQVRVYGQLLKKDLNQIPLNHQMKMTRYETEISGSDLHVQHVQNYYAVYRILPDDRFAIVALLWEGRDIPVLVHELAQSTQAEIDLIQDQIERGLL